MAGGLTALPSLSAALGLPGDPAVVTVALLVLAALVAGWVDAVVGGGGLVQLPALLIGLPAAYPGAGARHEQARRRSAGTATGRGTYRRVRPRPRHGGPDGGDGAARRDRPARCRSRCCRSGCFRPLVLVLLIVVAVYTWRRPELGLVDAPHPDRRRHRLVAVTVGAAIGFYDGIFGPGTGSFLVFALVGLLGYGFLQASAIAKITNLATNVGALLVFVPHGAPLWPLGALMATANVAGGYVGARTAARARQRLRASGLPRGGAGADRAARLGRPARPMTGVPAPVSRAGRRAGPASAGRAASSGDEAVRRVAAVRAGGRRPRRARRAGQPVLDGGREPGGVLGLGARGRTRGPPRAPPRPRPGAAPRARRGAARARPSAACARPRSPAAMRAATTP